MLVVRHGDKLTVSFPALEPTNLLVGHNMATGTTREDIMYRDGVARSLGWGLQGGLIFEPQACVFDLGKDGVPQAGQEFAFEHRVILFETDEPAQHMWSPTSGKHYKVLWSRTFREIVQ